MNEEKLFKQICERCENHAKNMVCEDIELIPDVKEDNFPKIDWEQRRYEIAKEMLPSIAKNWRIVVCSGSTPDKVKGRTLAEHCAADAITYADALIKELKRGVEQ